MIKESLAAFINACAGSAPDAGFGAGGFGDGGFGGVVAGFPYDLKGLGLNAYAKTPDTVVGELKAPVCLIDYLHEGPQDLWVIGDAQRKENPILSVVFYGTDYAQARDMAARFRRAIEVVEAMDVGDVLHPGIDFLACADRLTPDDDLKVFRSYQANWFTSPFPAIYKNTDANGEPVVITEGFSIDYVNGIVTFTDAQLSTDVIRATYKAGVIDFNIMGVDRQPEADMANNPQKHLAAFDLETHFYIKNTANRYL